MINLDMIFQLLSVVKLNFPEDDVNIVFRKMSNSEKTVH